MTTTPNPIYLVTVAHKSGAYIPERNVCDLGRAETIADIAAGHIEGVESVIEVNTADLTSRDVTYEIAREVMTLWADEGEPLTAWQRDFVEQLVSIPAANSFQKAVDEAERAGVRWAWEVA